MSRRILQTPSELIEEQINDLFLTRSDDREDLVVKAFSLILNMNTKGNPKNQDIVDLYNEVGIDTFFKIIDVLEKKTVTFPSRREIREAIILAVLYYYHEVNGMEWSEIKSIVPFEFSTISYSAKIKNMNKFVINNLLELFTEYNERGEK